MERAEALGLLGSSDAHDRLKAARFLARHPSPEDEKAIKEAIRRENVTWILGALNQGLTGLRPEPALPEDSDESLDTEDIELTNQIYSIAVEDTTRRLVHEIEPVLGALRISTRAEIPEFKESESWRYLDKLEALVSGISTLSKSASPPKLRQFDLAALIGETVSDEIDGFEFGIQVVGRSPLIVESDPELIGIVLRNGLANAIESTMSISSEERMNIVVSWGDTDVDYWISILDRGVGLPMGSQNVWDIGASTKRSHLGMGLPTALQAARSLSGSISLSPRQHGGIEFEFRWPGPKTG